MIDFDTARAIVAGSPAVLELFPPGDFMVGDYGWENSTDFLIPAGTTFDVTGRGDPGTLSFDAPSIYVAKETGALRLVYGLGVQGVDPREGMTVIGLPPQSSQR